MPLPYIACEIYEDCITRPLKSYLLNRSELPRYSHPSVRCWNQSSSALGTTPERRLWVDIGLSRQAGTGPGCVKTLAHRRDSRFYAESAEIFRVGQLRFRGKAQNLIAFLADHVSQSVFTQPGAEAAVARSAPARLARIARLPSLRRWQGEGGAGKMTSFITGPPKCVAFISRCSELLAPVVRAQLQRSSTVASASLLHPLELPLTFVDALSRSVRP